MKGMEHSRGDCDRADQTQIATMPIMSYEYIQWEQMKASRSPRAKERGEEGAS